MTKREEERIYSIIKDHNNGIGILGGEIAKIMGIDKKKVNHYLYYDAPKGKYIQNPRTYRWTLSAFSSTRHDSDDSVLCKLQNQSGAKIFSIDDFNDLADWSVGVSPSRSKKMKEYITESGNTIYCDSKSEITMLTYLEENGLIQDCGGQALSIVSVSPFGVKHSYSPDIAILTNDGHIAIIEVKSVTAMSNHSNIEKYEALGTFCKKNGFEYMMIDPDSDYMTFDELIRLDVSSELYEEFVEMEEYVKNNDDYECFGKDYVDGLFEDYGQGEFTRQEFDLMVHSLIIRFGFHNVFKNGFQVYTRPVKLNSDHEGVSFI